MIQIFLDCLHKVRVESRRIVRVHGQLEKVFVKQTPEYFIQQDTLYVRSHSAGGQQWFDRDLDYVHPSVAELLSRFPVTWDWVGKDLMAITFDNRVD